MIDSIPAEERREFVDLFVSETRSILGRLREVVQKGVGKDIDSVLHALKGTSGNFGARRISDPSMPIRRIIAASILRFRGESSTLATIMSAPYMPPEDAMPKATHPVVCARIVTSIVAAVVLIVHVRL